MQDKDSLKPVLESLIFASDAAISIDKLAGIIECPKELIREALSELTEEYERGGRGFFIEEVAGGFQFRTSPESAPYLRKLFKIGLQKISKAAMETLAVVAYKQPVTRGEIETVRGVDSGGVLATLMEKRFIKIVGRKEVPGRPVVYGTTKEFLETFELKDLSCLPSLKDIQLAEEEDAAEKGPLAHEEKERGEAGGGEPSGKEAGAGFEAGEDALLDARPEGPEGDWDETDGEAGRAGEGEAAPEGVEEASEGVFSEAGGAKALSSEGEDREAPEGRGAPEGVEEASEGVFNKAGGAKALSSEGEDREAPEGRGAPEGVEEASEGVFSEAGGAKALSSEGEDREAPEGEAGETAGEAPGPEGDTANEGEHAPGPSGAEGGENPEDNSLGGDNLQEKS